MFLRLINKLFPGIFFLLVSCSGINYDAYQSDNLSIHTNSNNANLDSLIAPYRYEVESSMNKTIGFTKEAFLNGKKESVLGNFIADIVFEYGMQLESALAGKMNVQNTMTLINFGGLRAPINQGSITIGNIFELMPFDNTITIVALNAALVDSMLLYLNKMQGQPISNAAISYDGKSMSTFSIHGVQVDKESSIYVITSDYLASGGDKMNFLKESKIKFDTGYLIRDAIIDYVEKMDTLKPKEIEGRITFN